MAASTSLKLLTPVRLWAGFSLAILIFISVTSLGFNKLVVEQNKKIIELQLESLLRSRFDDLGKSDYRSFVEGLGYLESQAYVSILADGLPPFFIGIKSKNQVCVMRDIFHGETNKKFKITYCRDFEVPVKVFTYFVLAFAVLSVLSLIVLSYLENRAWSSLHKLLGDVGFKVSKRTGLVGALKRLKEQNESYSRLQAEQVKLERTRAVNEYAAKIAHDIRSPLTTLRVLSEENVISDINKKLLFKRAVNKILQMADSLLAVRRDNNCEVVFCEDVESTVDSSSKYDGKFRLHDAIVNVVSEKKYEFANRREVSFKYYPQNENEIARGDALAFEGVLSNLLNNAYEAISDTGFITITLESDKENHNISIRDNGHGFDSSQKKVNSNGIGLSTSFKTLRAWGGNISIKSQVGLGSTITLTLKSV